jgi:hypothetical protein
LRGVIFAFFLGFLSRLGFVSLYFAIEALGTLTLFHSGGREVHDCGDEVYCEKKEKWLRRREIDEDHPEEDAQNTSPVPDSVVVAAASCVAMKLQLNSFRYVRLHSLAPHYRISLLQQHH